MNILYYECFAGISGDMNLGALIDLGVPVEYLKSELQKLPVPGYSISTEKSLKMGISGTKVTVQLTEHHGHHHHHHHEHHDHHRGFSDIKKLIEESELSPNVKKDSIGIFTYIAQAEGKIHNKPANEVHFHEVGAVDSIVDIVGAAICIDYLKPGKIMCSTVQLGGGFVKCAHGTFPVPAPATMEILQNVPVAKGIVQKETTTPTGAAILKYYVSEFTDTPTFSLSKTSYGLGHYDFDIPNVLRVSLVSEQSILDLETASATMIECNIDDMPAEHTEFVLKNL
ncbi:MAG: nickel pincer cofactor biosynthesis protein LarC, partial [Bacteroidales bacterium]|nr:nickel pincer cofactor biosynthesis protein LarC [Bacteroidales bacterium]